MDHLYLFSLSFLPHLIPLFVLLHLPSPPAPAVAVFLPLISRGYLHHWYFSTYLYLCVCVVVVLQFYISSNHLLFFFSQDIKGNLSGLLTLELLIKTQQIRVWNEGLFIFILLFIIYILLFYLCNERKEKRKPCAHEKNRKKVKCRKVLCISIKWLKDIVGTYFCSFGFPVVAPVASFSQYNWTEMLAFVVGVELWAALRSRSGNWLCFLPFKWYCGCVYDSSLSIPASLCCLPVSQYAC